MRKINLRSAESMLSLITSGVDLYCEDTETYVFLYNEEESICVYYGIDKEQADELEAEALANDEYWAAYLGWGGHIIDSDEWYAERGEERPKWMETPLEWCEKNYNGNWVVCGCSEVKEN